MTRPSCATSSSFLVRPPWDSHLVTPSDLASGRRRSTVRYQRNRTTPESAPDVRNRRFPASFHGWSTFRIKARRPKRQHLPCLATSERPQTTRRPRYSSKHHTQHTHTPNQTTVELRCTRPPTHPLPLGLLRVVSPSL